MRPVRSLVAGAILAALLSSLAVAVVTQVWSLPLHVPFQYAHAAGDDQEDATLDLMLIKNIHEAGWFDTNPKLNAPFQQHWAEWPMGGDLVAYTMKKVIVDTTGDVPLTFNLFWLLTFPLTALVAFPVLRSLRCSWATALVGAVLFSLAPYHFRNGAAHENLAFYVGVPIIVLLCVKILGPDSALPSVAELRHRAAWKRMGWLLLGAVLVGATGIYYLAFLLSLLVLCAVAAAVAHRRPGVLAIAFILGAAGLASSFLANLPTLLFRWGHAKNLLSVPARLPGSSEYYPLRLVELLSPVTAHRFGPFAALADHLYEPGREGLATANLGLAAAIGFVCAVTTVLVRAVRSAHRHGWSLEARLGVLMIFALLLATKGGLSRALELTGLQGVRGWNRIAIVIAFAAVVVFARLLDRLGAVMRGRRWRRYRLVWVSVLAVVLVAGVLDQASPAEMPNPQANSGLWRSNGAFVASIERQLPRNAMVFQLPVVSFPDDAGVGRMSPYDLIKEGYLHSKTLRWSAGGVEGRDGEWQWPAAQLPMRDLVRGLTAMGFSALTLDRYGFPDDGRVQLQELQQLLGKPIATSGDRLFAWNLRPVTASLLSDLSARGRHALAEQMLDAPRLYLSSDIEPLANRGDPQYICGTGSLTLVNPGAQRVRAELDFALHQRDSAARHGLLQIDTRTVPIASGWRGNLVPVEIRPGTTTIRVSIVTPGVRCRSTPTTLLPQVSAALRPLPAPSYSRTTSLTRSARGRERSVPTSSPVLERFPVGSAAGTAMWGSLRQLRSVPPTLKEQVMNTRPKRLRIGLAVAATTVGAALGGAAIAGAATNTTASTSATSTAPNAAPNPATVAHGPGETLLTGTTADKVKAAALAAVPGGTIIRVETDSAGSPYEAHVTKSDGSVVTVKVDANFKVTATDQGFGGGPNGGAMGAGPAA